MGSPGSRSPVMHNDPGGATVTSRSLDAAASGRQRRVMTAFPVPRHLAETARHDRGVRGWLAELPQIVAGLAGRWSLQVGEPFQPGGQCSWTAPVTGPAGTGLVLKVGFRFPGGDEREEAAGLRLWDGNGAVRLYAACETGSAYGLLIERCLPGTPLGQARPGPEQDRVVAGLLRQLWAQPETAGDRVLLCTDLHGGNILAAQRAPWLVIDPKPYVGDPAYDLLQHMLNCEDRLAADPAGLADRMAGLAGADAGRVRQWLFARSVQESVGSPLMREVARRLALTSATGA